MGARTKRLLLKKQLAQIRIESENHGLKRSLGPVQLVLLGIGCIVGAGIYVMTGSAAANYAGPAVVLSFMIAGTACAFTGLCYAELASTLPVSGSSYTYAYAALGEVFAWSLGWLLMLEYGLAGSALASGLSGYLASLLGDFGVHIPEAVRTPFIQTVLTPQGTTFITGGSVNLVAAASLGLVAAVLVRGVALSAAYSDEPYPITRALIEEGRRHLILEGTIALGCPVHILQGMKDPDVPWEHAMLLAEHLPGDGVKITTIPDGDHRLSRPEDLDRLRAAVASAVSALSSG